MTGILAINAFLHSEKYTQQDKLLLAVTPKPAGSI